MRIAARISVAALALIVSTLFAVTNVLACPPVYPVAKPSGDLAEVRQKLELLFSGTDEERRRIAAEAARHFLPLREALSDDDREVAEEIVLALGQWLLVEQDDWMVSSVLRELLHLDNGLLDPLYRDALQHDSPNVRWRGFQRFVRLRDEAVAKWLEHAWKSEQRDWLRPDLALALSCQGSTEHLDTMAEWLESDNTEFAIVAVRTLVAARGSETSETLVEHLNDAPPAVQRIIVEALGQWPGSDEVKSALLGASRSPDIRVRRSAVEALAGVTGDDAVLRRLIELAGKVDDWMTSRVAIFATFKASGGDLDRIRALAPARGGATDPLESVLLEVRRLAHSEYPERWSYVDREVDGRRFDPCGGLYVDTDPAYPRKLHVSALPGLASARCWEAPASEGDPVLYRRVPDGMFARLEDRFEAGSELWSLVQFPTFSPRCWIPRHELMDPADGPEGLSAEPWKQIVRPEDVGRFEFDLPLAELEYDASEQLLDAGVLEVFDVGRTVAGVSLMLEPAGQRADALAESYPSGSEILDRMLGYAAQGLRKSHPEHSGLAGVVEQASELADEIGWITEHFERTRR